MEIRTQRDAETRNNPGWRRIPVIVAICLAASSCFGPHSLPPRQRYPAPASMTKVDEESAAPAGQIRVPRTGLWLMVTESISSKTAKPGDRVQLQAVGGVRVGDLTVVANKAPAFATISGANKPGIAWRPGAIQIHLESVKSVDGRQIPLDGSPMEEEGRKATLDDTDVPRDMLSMTALLVYLLSPGWSTASRQRCRKELSYWG